ncbi:hypothetical protein CBOM_03069 [Ceraceosorus bombacis]|uniref:Secreted protein n=1 Tax=Ceraceosorus bombacis TaxID=401625 RepID=A0A0N7LAM4_9BASI|nr:hypothetical protein CBOM_03069 [Ceraceosorus bombacis]
MISPRGITVVLGALGAMQAAAEYVPPQPFTDNAVVVSWKTAKDAKCSANAGAASVCWVNACNKVTSTSAPVNLFTPLHEEPLANGHAWVECTGETSKGNKYSATEYVRNYEVGFPLA